MKRLHLKRIAHNTDGVFGVLLYEKIPFAVTLEPEDKNNQKNISCIPLGDYICKRVKSYRFGDTFEITNVPNRRHILFHKGNLEQHTQGCVLVAESFTEFNGKTGIGDSRGGYDEFMELFKDEDEFKLHISK